MKYFLILLVSFIVTSCNREECDFPGPYVFVLPISISPERDTFNIGDTINIVSKFNDDVFEKKTNKIYKLDNWKFNVSMILREISGMETNEAAIFDFTIIEDSISSKFSILDFKDGFVKYVGDYTYINNVYNFNYKIIPTKSGLYYMSHLTSVRNISSNPDFGAKCSQKKGNVDSDFKLNGGDENNIHLLSSSPIEHFNTWMLNGPADRYHRFAGYCFYVK